MKFSSRLIKLAPCLLLAIAVAFTCGGAAAQEAVTIQLKWRNQFQFAGYYAAKSLGYYAEAGLEVTIKEGFPNIDVVDEVLSGRAQYATGMPSLLVNRAKGDPVVVLAAIFQHSPEAFLSLESSGIANPEDLKGKRVAVSPHSRPSVMALLKAVGIGEDDYIQVPLKFGADQLLKGEADAIAAYITDEPYQLMQQGEAHTLLRPLGAGIDFYGDCLFTTDAELEQFPDRARRFREASLRGWTYAMAHREEVIALIENEYGTLVPHDHLHYEANAMQQLILPDLIDLGSMSVQRWERIRDTLAELDEMPSDFDVSPLLFNLESTVPLDRLRRLLTGALLIGAVLTSMLIWVSMLMIRRRQEAIETQTILDTAVQAIITADERGIIYAANRCAGQMFGYEPSELVGMRVEVLFSEEAREKHSGFVQRILRGDDESGFLGSGTELVARRRNGDLFPAHMSLGHSYAGVRHRFVAAIDDLTERQRFERELRQSELRLRTVIDTIHSVFFIKDRNGRHLLVNEFYEEATGYPAEQVLGRTDEDFFPPEVGRAIMDLDREVMASGKQQRFEESVPHPDGTMHTFLTEKVPLFDENGETMGLVGIATDITERKNMELELRAKEERLDLALNGAYLGLWDWQTPNDVQLVNDIWIDMLGYERAEFEALFPETHERWSKLVHPDDMSGVLEALRTHYEGIVPMYRAEMRMRTKPGEWKWILSSGRVISRTDSGEVLRVVGIHMDIDNYKRLQQELEAAREVAESADRAKSRFLANMSHEIRTPMNAILNLAELLLDSQLDERQHQYLRVVHTSAKSLLKLINDVLDLSKIEAGKFETEAISFNLGELMEDLLLTFGEQASRKGIELTIHVEDGTPEHLSGDMYRLRQVLINLIGNAIKFTERGEVSVLARSAGQAEHGLVPLVLEVRDTGIGIDPHQADRLFDAFSQADSSTTRRFGGTGLGLAISQRLVSLMGGDGIVIESSLGSGSVFRFQLPFSLAACPLPLRHELLDGVRVLLVENDAGARGAYASMLERCGATVVQVATTSEADSALRAAQDATPVDVVVLDWNLNGGDAAALASRIREGGEALPLPLVVVAGLTGMAEIDRLREMGVSALLRKPVTATELHDAVLDAIGRRSSLTVAPGSPSRVSEPTVDFDGVRVLLVEDNRVNQMVAREMLKRKGFDIMIAENGRVALERLEQEAFDIVLMDVQMPEMDGLEATRRIRENEAQAAHEGLPARHIPILAMTANAMPGDERICLDAGMDAYVAKPLNLDSVLNNIAHLLPPRTA